MDFYDSGYFYLHLQPDQIIAIDPKSLTIGGAEYNPRSLLAAAPPLYPRAVAREPVPR